MDKELDTLWPRGYNLRSGGRTAFTLSERSMAAVQAANQKKWNAHPERRKAHGKAIKARWKDPAGHAVYMAGRTAEVRARTAASVSKIMNDPVRKAAHSKAMKAAWRRNSKLRSMFTPEVRAKQSKAEEANWASPQYRANREDARLMRQSGWAHPWRLRSLDAATRSMVETF